VNDEAEAFAALREIDAQLALGGLTANAQAALTARRKRLRATYGAPPPALILSLSKDDPSRGPASSAQIEIDRLWEQLSRDDLSADDKAALRRRIRNLEFTEPSPPAPHPELVEGPLAGEGHGDGPPSPDPIRSDPIRSDPILFGGAGSRVAVGSSRRAQRRHRL
jgi:hypothetical protein